MSIIADADNPSPITYMRDDDLVTAGNYLQLVLVADKENNITIGHLIEEWQAPRIDQNADQTIIDNMLQVKRPESIIWKREKRAFSFTLKINSQQTLQESK